MIKQICPHCLKPVSVPDTAAGATTPCPECGKVIPVQARYNPVVAPAPPVVTSPPALANPEPVPMSTAPPIPAPPPGYVPAPASTQLEPSLPPTPPMPVAPAGYSRSVGIAFSPRIIAWLPALCLTMTLVATFFSWVGAYAGGYPVYAQGPWAAMWGTVSRDALLEAAVRDQIPDGGAWLDQVRSDWEFVLPYLVCLALATAFAWGERGFANLDKDKLPPLLKWVTAVWPYRIIVITLLAALAFILITVQVINGFGLERAARQNVAKRFEDARAKAGVSASALARIRFEEEQELNKYNLQRTSWMYLGLGLHLLAVLAMVARVGFDARGNKPPPRIVIQY